MIRFKKCKTSSYQYIKSLSTKYSISSSECYVAFAYPTCVEKHPRVPTDRQTVTQIYLTCAKICLTETDYVTLVDLCQSEYADNQTSYATNYPWQTEMHTNNFKSVEYHSIPIAAFV